MADKLKELTDRLYGEGLKKGRDEAERLVAEARAEAEKILAEARDQAENIVRQAEKKAADTEKNAMTEIALAGRQAVDKIKDEIVSLVIARTAGEGVRAAVLDADFVKKMLLETAKPWNGGDGKAELEALLPEAQRAEFAAAFEAAAGELFDAGIEVGYSPNVRNGFRVASKQGGYYIAFTDESFEALMKEYLRDKVARILFA